MYQQGIIGTATKIADYLGILFNWEENKVCSEQGDRNCSQVKAKTIVLETVYAIANRIQDLMKQLILKANASLMDRRASNLDPATISCALWIIYSSVNKWQKLGSGAKSLQGLVRYLSSNLHACGCFPDIE
jgi:hypothetical protein